MGQALPLHLRQTEIGHQSSNDVTAPLVDPLWAFLHCKHFLGKVPATEIFKPVGDWNGHVGATAGVFSDAHGGHGFG